LLLALKAGERPENFAAEMECAYINGHQSALPVGSRPAGHARRIGPA